MDMRITDRQSPDWGDTRLLHRLRVEEGTTGRGDPVADAVAVVIDVETTGTDPTEDAVIELALRRFRHDRNGVITKIDRAYSWLEDPGVEIPPHITRLTGLGEDDLAGHEIDAGAVARLMRSASVVIAHNAGFDRKVVERRIPEAAGLPWACSMDQVDWPGLGFDGRKLGHLLVQCGWFHDAHRAAGDVDAVIGVVGHVLPDGSTVLSHLLEAAARPGWLVRAVGAAFALKGRLKARGYRWDGASWWREVSDDDRMAEEFWLAANVYSVDADPRKLGPSWEEIDWCRRYA